jgi:hypothetical protein
MAAAFRPLAAAFALALAGTVVTTPAGAGGPLTSAVTTTGSVSGPSYTESWTFDGAANERIMIAAVTTSGALNTVVTLKAPGGAVLFTTPGDRTDYQLPSNGTYTVEISDQGVNDAGTYALTWLNLTAGPYTDPGDLDGGPIGSGQVLAASMSGAADLDAFTFSGTAGERIVFGVLEGAPPPLNVTLILFPPGGGAYEASLLGNNRLDVRLAATGTYTVVVDDIGNDHAGAYSATFLNVSAGPHAIPADLDSGVILSAYSVTGTMNGVLDLDAFTFTGTIGDRIAVVGLTTSGTMNTQVSLYPPDGTGPQISTAVDRWDFKLTQSGVHTLVIEDQNFGESGTYLISLLNLTSGPLTQAGDLDGGPIASGEVRAGGLGAAGDLDAFTFAGVAGQRILCAAFEGSASPFNTTLTLYPPGGGPHEAQLLGNNRLDVQLAATGTYTLVVEDINNDHPGAYTVSHLNVTAGPHATIADPDGGPYASATHATGTMNGVLDWDAFTISGNAGERVMVAAVTASGTMNTMTYLYPPNGGAPQIATAVDRWDFQLTQSGSHVLVIEDQNFGETGTYALTFLNLTAGPLTYAGDLDGDAILSNQVRTGTMGVASDLDAYTFTATAGDRVVIGGVTTAGGPAFNTLLTLFPPGGGAQIAGSSGNDRLDLQVAASGTYTLVIDDIGNLDAGSYGVSFVNLSAGPISDVTDLDGGWLVTGDVRNGNVSPIPDLDVYWFNAQAGDTAKVDCVTTSGALNTMTWLYPPGGGAAVVSTLADSWTHPVAATGRYALLVQHLDLTQTGGYQLGLSGPITTTGVPGEAALPERLVLSPAFPNPSRGTTAFTLSLPHEAAVEVQVYDVRGALVRTLARGAFPAGMHTIGWDGRDDQGRRLGSGVYLVRLRADGTSWIRRLVRVD